MRPTERDLMVARAVYDLPVLFDAHDREARFIETIKSLPEPEQKWVCDTWGCESYASYHFCAECALALRPAEHGKSVRRCVVCTARHPGADVAPALPGKDTCGECEASALAVLLASKDAR